MGVTAGLTYAVCRVEDYFLCEQRSLLSDENPNLLRRVLRVMAEIIVAIYVVADSTVAFLFRPVMRFLSSLRIVQRMERGIDAMHPYVILVIMLVPFIIAEFAKVFAVFWMSEGHLRSGMTIFIGAYIVSIFVCERILHAGKRKLMTIAWFAWCYNWVVAFRDYLFGWFRATLVWRKSLELCATRRRLCSRAATTGFGSFSARNRETPSSVAEPRAFRRPELRLRRGIRCMDDGR